ncbi:MAG TPA: metal ABC transporter permease, partial [Syntrophomonadaceae bacterium]|nr:metal ABC transporter permease [Syntrophomonadaceae bacterium]
MEIWYHLINLLLPFEWTQHEFMKNALLGVLMVTPVFGLMGTMVVNNKMAFFSDALGHSALTGIAIGVLLGINQPLWAMLAFSVILSVFILMVKNANTASTDTIIGVFSSTAVALGIALLSLRGGFNKYSAYLIGDLLSISSTDLTMLFIVLVLVIAMWFLIFNKMLMFSINQSLAASRGINVHLYDYVFTLVIAVTVTIAIQWVGILIISSLLVLPAAAARNIARDMRQYHVWSVAIALFSGLTGLILSYYAGTATGATIVVIAA